MVPPTVLACIDDAVAKAPALIDKTFEVAAAALDEDAAARRGDMRTLQEAAQELRGAAMVSRTRYGTLLRRVLTGQKEEAAFSDFSALTLVDDAQVVEKVDSGRLTQELTSRVDESLSELNALVSAALGHPGIQPEDNPLRPEAFATALRQVLGEATGDSARPALWMRHMSRPLAAELSQLYRTACQRLKSAGVQAAGYRVLQTPSAGKASPVVPAPDAGRPAPAATGDSPSRAQGVPGQPGQGYAGPGAAAAPAASRGQEQAEPLPTGPGFVGWIGRAVQALRGPLMRDFLGGNAAGRLPAQQQLDGSWYDHVDREMADLQAAPVEAVQPAPPVQRLLHMAPADRPARSVETSASLTSELWGEYAAARQRNMLRLKLKREARRVGQVMGLEVVRQLLDEVARDPRLLAPVREAFVALEPALLRLALSAPEFFGKQDHPARKLLESVAERSLRYNDEGDRMFVAFMEPVRTSFKSLNALETIDDAVPFEQQLQALQKNWTEEDEREAEQRRKLLEAVKFAERRQSEAARIAADLSARDDLNGVPRLVQEFLFEQWALVLAHARLTASSGSQLDPGGFLAVVADLLWTVKADAVRREPGRAFEALPKLIPKLREGLALLGQAPADSQAFFGALEQLHRPILDLRARLRKQTLAPAAPVAVPAEKMKPAQAQKPSLPETVWLAPGELLVCGFEEGQYTDETLPLARPPARSANAVDPADADNFVDGLPEGGWVDLYTQNRWRRARLAWCGTRRSLFMFVSEGGRPHSMSRRNLLRLVSDGQVRAVESGEVVQRAIDALSSNAQAQPLAA